MRIEFVASDSMGTRSMATYVEAGGARIFIDPGVALGPRRYGLPPHPLELGRLEEHWRAVVNLAKKADAIIITHYHYDHHSPWEGLEIYEGKKVLVKHPTQKINLSQKGRAALFLEAIKGLPSEVDYCDGKEYALGGAKIKFSKPVCHGANPRLGYVVEVLIDDGSERFLFTSDVEGPSLKDQASFMIENEPNLIYLDGPMTYMLGYRYSQKSLEESLKAIARVLSSGSLKTLVVDHHLLRDLEWERKLQGVIEEAGRRGVKVETAADFEGKPRDMLEARRRELYEKRPAK